MTDEERKAIEIEDSISILENTDLDINNIYSIDLRTYNVAVKTVVEVIKKQFKEIEELKDMNERQQYRIELVSEDEIEERGDSIDESTMLKQIKNKLDEKNIPIETLLAEFERLEDLEDRKVQIEYNNVFNKGVKSVEDKIKAKIDYLLKRYDSEEDFCSYDVLISILKSLLRKEFPVTITKEELEKRWKE